MINVHIYKKIHLMPENWNELTGKQLVKIAGIINRPEKSFKEKVYLLKTCLGMSDRAFMSYGYLPKWLNDKLFWKKVEVLLFLERSLYLVDFLLQSNELTNQLLPKIGKYYGPSDNFENLRMDEFCWSEFWYLKYKDDHSREALVNLVATLYRPRPEHYDKKLNPLGDYRATFNKNLTKHYAAKLQKVETSILQAVAIWYEGCRFNLVKLFPKVFSGKGGDGESFGLFSLITGVAEDGVMGDFDKVNSKEVHEILLRLTELIMKAEKLEAELKKSSSS